MAQSLWQIVAVGSETTALWPLIDSYDATIVGCVRRLLSLLCFLFCFLLGLCTHLRHFLLLIDVVLRGGPLALILILLIYQLLLLLHLGSFFNHL